MEQDSHSSKKEEVFYRVNMGSKTNKIYNKDNDKEEIEHQFKIIGEYLYVNRPFDMPGE